MADPARWRTRLDRQGMVVVVMPALALLIFIAALGWMTVERYAAPPVDASLPTIGVFWATAGLVWAALTFAAMSLARDRAAPLGLSRGQGAWLILLVAAVARLLVMATTSPVLSDDIWRYIHDGHMLRQGVNPYQHAPAALAESPELVPNFSLSDNHRTVLARVNNPDMVTIYLPASQWVFAALATTHHAIGGWQSLLDPLGDRTFRLGFILLDLLVVALLLARLRDNNASPWWAMLYAWHPLPLSEVAAAGHQDVIGIAMLLVCLHVFEHARLSRPHAAFSGLCLGVAAVVKPVVAPVGVVLVYFLRRSTDHAAMLALTTCLVLAVTFLPFAMMDGGLAGLVSTLLTFANHWSFNSSLFVPLLELGLPKSAVQFLAAAAMITVLVQCLRRGTDRYTAAGWLFFVGLLVSSTVHPWYLLWALAMLPLGRFNPAMWVMSLTITWSYAALLDMSVYQPSPWIVAAAYVPVYLALGWWWWDEELRRRPRG